MKYVIYCAIYSLFGDPEDWRVKSKKTIKKVFWHNLRKYSDIILGTDDSCSKGRLDASKSSRSPLYHNSRSSDKNNGSYLASPLCSKDKLLKQNGYRLFHVNTCSLLPKIPELRALAEKYHIHLMSINETHLDETVNDFELEIPGFVIYRNDRNRHGGGVALYVRDDVKHKPRKDLTIPGLESVWIVNWSGMVSTKRKTNDSKTIYQIAISA